MRIIHLAIKDFSQILRDWKSGLFLLIMPLLFTLFFGFVLGSSTAPKPDVDPRLPVGVIDRDGRSLVSDLQTLLENSDVIRPVALKREEWEKADQMVTDGHLAAVVVILPGYTDQLLADRPIPLDVIIDQNLPSSQTV